jgi:hypothetical protein
MNKVRFSKLPGETLRSKGGLTAILWNAIPFSADTWLAILKALSIALALTWFSIGDVVAAAPDPRNLPGGRGFDNSLENNGRPG